MCVRFWILLINVFTVSDASLFVFFNYFSYMKPSFVFR